MFNNGKMKLAAIVFITVLTVSGASAAISDIDMDPLLSQYEKGASITVTGTVYGTDIDKVTLQRETDYGGSVNVGNDKDLGYCSYGCKVSIDYTFKETGTHDFFLRAFDDEQRKNSNFETVDVVQLKEAGFKLKDVKATGYTLEEHNSTYLQAVVKNTGVAGGSVLVKWYADNGEKTLLAKKWQYLSSGERETLQSSELTWENLKNSLTVGEDYQLVGELYFNGEKLGSMTSSYGKLHLEKKETRPSLSIKTVDEEDNALENVKISINGESYKTRSNGKLELELKQGAYTIKASKSGYKDADKSIYLSKGESESITLKLEKREQEKAALTVKIVDGEGDRISYSHIEVDGKSKNTYSDGKAKFTLESGSYVIKASRSGYEDKEKGIYLSPGEDQTETLTLERKAEKGKLRVYTGEVNQDGPTY
ncbi:MAG: carboxypeptidase-like regulatory domain-containing protein, partial [Candidatus Nanohaloarchaea archaeon]